MEAKKFVTLVVGCAIAKHLQGATAFIRAKLAKTTKVNVFLRVIAWVANELWYGPEVYSSSAM